MKFVDGPSLDKYHRKHRPMLFTEVIKILQNVAEALDYAHARNVIHRDIKPSNIMIDKTDGVQLIDFGLAEVIPADQTQTGHLSVVKITGTRSYMAPEQWQGKRQDARTDQYRVLRKFSIVTVRDGINP
jgi:Serine/threonine protein kinase